MKYKKLFLMMFSLFSVLGIASFAYMQNRSTPELILKIDSPKSYYKLGEPINFSFELQNKSNEMITLLDVFGAGTGHLHIKVSQNGDNYLGADDPSWGKVDTTGKTYIKSGENAKAYEKILWNLSAQETARFKFDEPGVYYFKAYYTAWIGSENSPIIFESEPIQITIEEPTTEDLKVWNKIKNNGGIAYFIQEGDFHIPSYKTKEREKLKQEIEQLINQYPNSFYAESLRLSLDKFQVNEAKRQESMQKLKAKQP